jgi:hypothetical protein
LSFRSVDLASRFRPQRDADRAVCRACNAVHRRNARVFLDIAINHTGWAANLHTNHPEWLSRTPEGRIEVPGAGGVQWDLTKLDYRHQELWQFMAEAFLTWCRRGVDGFRCDAGYMVPHAAWKYIVARVREQFPATTFVLEGLGGKISVTRQLLNTANLNWAYSELFQNYDRSQLERYLPEAIEISAADGLTVHFAETHDNLRLAARSHTYARMRTALCALAAPSGAFGGPAAIACALVIRPPAPGLAGAAMGAAAALFSTFSTAAASPHVESGSGVASTIVRFAARAS